MPDPTFALVNCVSAGDTERLLARIEREGWTVVGFDGAGVTDKASFLKRAEAELPRPPDLRPHNWDAFADTLWNGLADLGAEDVALVWTSAHEMERGDLQDFLMAVEIMSRVAREVPPAVRLFLVGDGSEFRPLGH